MINQVNVKYGKSYKVNQDQTELKIKQDHKESSCAEEVKIDFCENYAITVSETSDGKAEVILYAGGIHRKMDLSTLQHLVAMTY